MTEASPTPGRASVLCIREGEVAVRHPTALAFLPKLHATSLTTAPHPSPSCSLPRARPRACLRPAASLAVTHASRDFGSFPRESIESVSVSVSSGGPSPGTGNPDWASSSLAWVRVVHVTVTSLFPSQLAHWLRPGTGRWRERWMEGRVEGQMDGHQKMPSQSDVSEGMSGGP